MGASGSNSPKPLAKLFGADEQGARRGPTLGSILVPGGQAAKWNLVVVSPLRAQVFNALDAKAVPLEDSSVISALKAHPPFTAFSCLEDTAVYDEAQALAIGCQDGTVLVLGLSQGNLIGPACELRMQEELTGTCAADESAKSSNCLTQSITALSFPSKDKLFAGSCSKCCCWQISTGELHREFHLPGNAGHPSTPTALALVPVSSSQPDAAYLWVGLDTGMIAVFDVQTGILSRTFACAGSEAVVSLARCPSSSVVFALSAHKRVSIWDIFSYECLQKYPAALVTCGSDLSAMAAVNLRSLDMSLLLLAGVNGSLCIRRVTRRADGKLNCVLLMYLENAGSDMGCPITSINYHTMMDSALLGDAGCNVILLQSLRDHLGATVEMAEPGSMPRLAARPSEMSTASVQPQAFGRLQDDGLEVPDAIQHPAASLTNVDSVVQHSSDALHHSEIGPPLPSSEQISTAHDANTVPFPVFSG